MSEKRLSIIEGLELAVAYVLLLAAAIMILATCSMAKAEGLVYIPGQGWRAAPCCRSYGVPGIRGIPPLENLFGVLAGVMAPLMAPPFGYGPPMPQPPIYGPAVGPPPPRVYQDGRYPPRPPLNRAPPAPGYGPYAGTSPGELPPPPAAPQYDVPDEQMPAPEPVVPGQPDNRFLEFCNANPNAPPCRGRVRGQR
jgi:hypothetical protein